jgi:TDG/mug DNA glycosylase family protein
MGPMDRATIDAYEQRGGAWVANRKPVRRAAATAFSRRLPAGMARVDLGCGAGRYLGDLGGPAVGLDASIGMLARCRSTAPDAPLVCGDLEALPFGPGAFGGAWANMSYLHLRRVQLPMALADLHRMLAVGAPLDLQVLAGDYEGHSLEGDDVGGRFFAGWRADALTDVVVGAGFEVDGVSTEDDVLRLVARRRRSLADTVGAGMTMLLVGLNPSERAADAGVPFAPRGNRFWTAAAAAGIVSRDRDPRHALVAHGVGMTDLVKRASARADTVTAEEYRAGMGRMERLVTWLGPGVVCFVGLAGWRAAVDRSARPGPQERRLGGRPVYLMPSTSGANAHADLRSLAGHLSAARAVAQGAVREGAPS